MGDVIHADFGGPGPLLTKTQLSRHPAIRRSRRWIEQRVAEGMPSTFDGRRRWFSLPEVRAWLVEHGKGADSSPPGPAVPSDKPRDDAPEDEDDAPLSPVIA